MPAPAIQEARTKSAATRQTDADSPPNRCGDQTELPTAKPKQCASHYKQLAFALPFFAVYLCYLGAACSPCAFAVAVTAGLLAGATSLGLYKAIKMVRQQMAEKTSRLC